MMPAKARLDDPRRLPGADRVGYAVRRGDLRRQMSGSRDDGTVGR